MQSVHRLFMWSMKICSVVALTKTPHHFDYLGTSLDPGNWQFATEMTFGYNWSVRKQEPRQRQMTTRSLAGHEWSDFCLGRPVPFTLTAPQLWGSSEVYNNKMWRLLIQRKKSLCIALLMEWSVVNLSWRWSDSEGHCPVLTCHSSLRSTLLCPRDSINALV